MPTGSVLTSTERIYQLDEKTWKVMKQMVLVQSCQDYVDTTAFKTITDYPAMFRTSDDYDGKATSLI